MFYIKFKNKNTETETTNWIDETPMDYMNWKADGIEPDTTWPCVAGNGQDGKWMTTNCDQKYEWLFCSITPICLKKK